jgi:periplasmic divalent cation tolerance protein
MSSARLVYCTFPNASEAEEVARALVHSRLAACVNIVGSVRSIYRWEGEVCSEEEYMIIAKTMDSRFDALKAKILELHSYDCPEVVAVNIDDGHEAYLQWIAEETSAGN